MDSRKRRPSAPCDDASQSSAKRPCRPEEPNGSNTSVREEDSSEVQVPETPSAAESSSASTSQESPPVESSFNAEITMADSMATTSRLISASLTSVTQEGNFALYIPSDNAPSTSSYQFGGAVGNAERLDVRYTSPEHAPSTSSQHQGARTTHFQDGLGSLAFGNNLEQASSVNGWHQAPLNGSSLTNTSGQQQESLGSLSYVSSIDLDTICNELTSELPAETLEAFLTSQPSQVPGEDLYATSGATATPQSHETSYVWSSVTGYFEEFSASGSGHSSQANQHPEAYLPFQDGPPPAQSLRPLQRALTPLEASLAYLGEEDNTDLPWLSNISELYTDDAFAVPDEYAHTAADASATGAGMMNREYAHESDMVRCGHCGRVLPRRVLAARMNTPYRGTNRCKLCKNAMPPSPLSYDTPADAAVLRWKETVVLELSKRQRRHHRDKKKRKAMQNAMLKKDKKKQKLKCSQETSGEGAKSEREGADEGTSTRIEEEENHPGAVDEEDKENEVDDEEE